MSVCVMLKISVTTQMTRLCLSVNMPAGPVMFVRYFQGVERHSPILNYFYFLFSFKTRGKSSQHVGGERVGALSDFGRCH